ncbi:MAG: hydrogenase maturation protease [Burkholderiales bacterium]|nr:hydrogenase maturation protease [Burkholderiales bacterium]
MNAPFLIFGIGNESRGDDALGPLLLRRLADEVDSKDVELIETCQLQIEHALDIAGRTWVLFVDAGKDTPDPHQFYRARPATDRTPFSHALSPEAVLCVHEKITGAAPAAHVLCIRGEDFELGHPLSEKAASRLESAFHFLQGILSLNIEAAGELGKLRIPG